MLSGPLGSRCEPLTRCTAIELAVAQQAEVAVIDVRMPEVDGLETARRLRKRSPETSVILVTGLYLWMKRSRSFAVLSNAELNAAASVRPVLSR